MSAQGVWINEYGSLMTLAVDAGGSITGTYESTTGSTGKYVVIGHQQPADPTSAGGQALVLAIHWHSIQDGPPDASWHWSSGLSGQISVKEGAETMVLAHALVVTEPFPGFAPMGTYIDKLTYRRVSQEAGQSEAPHAAGSVSNPLAGRWRSADGTMLDIKVTPYGSGEFGWISGQISTGTVTAEIAGVTDIKAAHDGLTQQSAAVTARLSSWGAVVSLSGSLNLTGRVLTMLDLSSAATAPNATYMQTTVSTKTFAPL